MSNSFVKCSYLFIDKSAKQQDWTENLTTPVAADMIGTPDPISNLRPVKYYIPSNETTEEREWRESCQRVDAFNEDFWQKNNTLFMNAKAEFEDQCKLKNTIQNMAMCVDIFR
jgi:hypothetical protein